MKRCRYREAIAAEQIQDGAWGKGVGDEMMDALTRRILYVLHLLDRRREGD